VCGVVCVCVCGVVCVCVWCGVCMCVPPSTFKKIGMNFILLNLPQAHIFKFPTIANDMEDGQTNAVGATTTPPSRGS